MTDPKNLNKCCPTNDGNVGKAIHSLSNRIQCLERINSDIENSLDEEKSRAIDAENTLQQHIEEEQNRASTKEKEILLALNEKQSRVEAVESALSNVIESIPNAQILSDWNLSDSNAKDFIKNKPQILDGKSAYELAVDNGFEGTEQEWLASLKGPQGIQGEQGPRGETGEQGILGIQGPIGPQGLKGDKGDPFKYEDFTSEQLEQLRGSLGIQGEKGEKGDTGDLGPQGPQGILGPKGDDGTMTFEDLTEEQRESLRGPLGIQGPAGQDGVDGQDGAPGLDGHSPVVTASKSGSTTTIYVDGTSIATIEDGLDGQDGQNGTNGTNGTNGLDGVTPHIDSTTGNWFIGTTDTGVHALGPAGLNGSNGTNGSNGQDGHTPVITASKNNGVTTISVDGTAIATINDGQDGSNGTNGTNGLDGAPGQDGITPHIDSTTKHWMIGETDTGVVAEGLNVADPVTQSELEEVEKVTAIALTQLDERVSDLENDGVATSSNYYDKSEIDLMFVNAAGGGSVDLGGYAKTADLATVATSGSYADLNNKPTIPTVPSNETAVSGGTTLSVVTTGEKYTWNNKSNFSGDYDDLSDKPTIPIIQNNHEYVDLGLPSGTLWASRNVGAWSQESGLSAEGIGVSSDVPTYDKYMGGSWHLPKEEQFQELLNYTTTSKEVINDVWGIKFTSTINNNWIFLPVLGSDSSDFESIYYVSKDGSRLSCYSDKDENTVGVTLYGSGPIINAGHITARCVLDGTPTKTEFAKVWRGTQVQYDAITTPDNNTIYIITAT